MQTPLGAPAPLPQPVLDTLAHIRLSAGHHWAPADGLCVMECVAFVAGERHSDRPACACPVITELAIYANDAPGFLAQHEKELTQRVVALAGSKASAAITRARACFLLNHVLQLLAVGPLQRTRPSIAKMISALPQITGNSQLPALRPVLDYVKTQDQDESLRLKLTEPLRGAIHGLETTNSVTICLAALQMVSLADLTPDLLGLLDSLLAIGAGPAVVTPQMKVRIAMLASEAGMRDSLLAIGAGLPS